MVVELTAVLGGTSAAFLWAAQGGYIHYVCEQNDMKLNKGYYYGLFYSMYCIANITSGVMTTFVLGFFSTAVYFWVLLGIGVSSILFCIFFVKNVQNTYGGDIRI